jgi:hypothetical protein
MLSEFARIGAAASGVREYLDSLAQCDPAPVAPPKKVSPLYLHPARLLSMIDREHPVALCR